MNYHLFAADEDEIDEVLGPPAEQTLRNPSTGERIETAESRSIDWDDVRELPNWQICGQRAGVTRTARGPRRTTRACRRRARARSSATRTS
jgi:hypothetical protein